MVRIEALSGADLKQHVVTLGRLRVRVFRAWPYLYDGDDESEVRHLAAFAASPRAAAFAAFDGETPVGMSTCMPLADETEEVTAPFAARGIAPERVFYFGESVLLPEYRGQGIGVRFFEARERQAREASDCEFAAFCAVQRAADDPRRPADAAPLDRFWRNRGFAPRPDLVCTMRWREVGATEETEQRLAFWVKSLSGAALP